VSSRRSSTVYSMGCAATVVAILGVLLSVPASGQVAGATLSGTIKDSSGAVVPEAKVAIRNVATGVATELATNTDGFYTAANLLPGDYEVTVSAKGFNTERRTGI
jgi:hypothetical protein